MERLYSIREIRALLGLGAKAALRVFEPEPGVLPAKKTRGYFPPNSNWRLFAPRIPESVLVRVQRRLQESKEQEYRAQLIEVMVEAYTRAIPRRAAPASAAELARRWRAPLEVADVALRRIAKTVRDKTVA